LDLGLNIVTFCALAYCFYSGCALAREACERMTALSNLRKDVDGLETQYLRLEEEFNATFALVDRNLERIKQML